VRDISRAKRSLVPLGKIGTLLEPRKVRAHRSIVPVRRIFRCSCMIP